jgi:hypothetical protein
MLLAALYFAVSGRKWFTGPKINLDHIPSTGEALDPALAHNLKLSDVRALVQQVSRQSA